MRQFCYQSTARPGLSAGDVGAIIHLSRRNNRQVGVTGVLLFDGRRFLQLLEGEAAAVESVWRRIARDGRHAEPEVVADRAVDVREFGHWDMALLRLDGSGFTRELEPLLAKVGDAALRARFAAFADVRRS